MDQDFRRVFLCGNLRPLPVNTVLPAISGTPNVGQTLTCSTGTWINAVSFAYQWLRDGVAIAGSTANTYLLVTADALKEISCRVTATNDVGSTQATSATASIVGDPHIASVSLLLGFEGSDGATSTTDESPNGHTVTFVGNAQIDTAEKQFGASAVLFDGTGDRLTIPHHASLLLGSGPFTIEAFVRFSTLDANSRGIMGKGTQSAGQLEYTMTASATGEFSFVYSIDGGLSYGETVTSSGAALTTGVFYFLVVDRDSAGKIRLFKDTTMVGSGTPADANIDAGTGTFALGAQNASGTVDMAGWHDEVRITKGISRYGDVTGDSNITVPTSAFPRS